MEDGSCLFLMPPTPQAYREESIRDFSQHRCTHTITNTHTHTHTHTNTDDVTVDVCLKTASLRHALKHIHRKHSTLSKQIRSSTRKHSHYQPHTHTHTHTRSPDVQGRWVVSLLNLFG